MFYEARMNNGGTVEHLSPTTDPRDQGKMKWSLSDTVLVSLISADVPQDFMGTAAAADVVELEP